MTGTTPSDGTYPRSVTPGIETHAELEDGMMASRVPPPGVYVGLDWMRFTGPDRLRGNLICLMESLFGTNNESSHGAKYFKHGLHWKPGVLMSWGHRSDVMQVDIQGGRLRLMGGDERMALCRRLMQEGLKPTRIDGAIDFIDQSLGLCESAEASCRRAELCLLRKWSPNHEFETDGTTTRLLLRLGSRESPVCARIYDKGLEQKVAMLGRWERIEVEWKGDRACAVTRALHPEMHGDGWAAALAAMAFGAVDFRRKTGRSELARRKRAEWWERAIAGHATVAVSPAIRARTFERWYLGFVRSYGRRLGELAIAVGSPVGDVAEFLLRGVEASEGGAALTAEFIQLYTPQSPSRRAIDGARWSNHAGPRKECRVPASAD